MRSSRPGRAAVGADRPPSSSAARPGSARAASIAELGRAAREDGGAVLEGASVSLGDDEGLPLAPIADALRALARQLPTEAVQEVVGSAGPALGRLVPELGATTDASDAATRPDWVQARMLEAVLGVLHRLGERQPVLLLVEDLHWADRSTRDVLAFIARTARTERLLVVGTYRTDEIHRRHPIRPWLAEMERTPRVDRLTLERLGGSALADLVDAIRALPPDETLLRTIADRSEGNPFYVEELLAAGATPVERRAAVRPARGPAQPRRVASRTRSRRSSASRRSPVDRSSTTCCVRWRGSTTKSSRRAMREAVAAGIVVATADGTTAVYAFRHALLQEAVYDDLLPTERRRYHATYAAALRERPVPDGAAGAGHLAALAHHASASHDLAAALDAWVAAGRASVEAYAFPAAARSLERALDLWEAVPLDDRPTGVDQIQLLYELSFARMLAGEMGGAVDAAGRAVELSSRPRTRSARRCSSSASVGRRGSTATWKAGSATTPRRSRCSRASRRRRPSPGSSAATARCSCFAATIAAPSRCRPRRSRSRGPSAPNRPSSTPSTPSASRMALLGDCAGGIEIGARRSSERSGSAISTILAGHTATSRRSSRSAAARRVRRARRRGLGVGSAEWRLADVRSVPRRQPGSALIDVGRWHEARDLLARTWDEGPQGVAILNHAVNAGPLAVRMGDLDAGPLHPRRRCRTNGLVPGCPVHLADLRRDHRTGPRGGPPGRCLGCRDGRHGTAGRDR